MQRFFQMELISALFVLVLGTLSHFFYQWSGKNKTVGFFAAVNESSWEHLKLLFFPYLLLTACQYILFGQFFPNFLLAKALGVLAGMLAILVLFYTYTGIIGENFLLADILCFAVGVCVSFFVSDLILLSGTFSSSLGQLPGILLWGICLALFLLFTPHPPRLALFRDPVQGFYGFPSS